MWLIRHAESTWNADGRWQGQSDPPLSERGEAQARELGCRLTDAPIARIVSSDLTRAAQTARALGDALGLTPEHDARLREIEAGSWAGLNIAEIEARDGDALAHFRSGDVDARVGGGESRRMAANRAAAALRELRASSPDASLAVVTHGGVVRSLFPDVELRNTEWVRLAPEDPVSGIGVVSR